MASAAPQTFLLETKLSEPSARDNSVVRRRMLERFADFQPGGVWLVHAPAGFGKTTLLGQIRATLTQQRHRTGWITLDDADCDPKGFLAYAHAAVGLALGQANAAAIKHAEETFYLSIDEIGISLINRVARARVPVALLIDDYHRAQGDETDRVLRWIVDHQPAGMTLIVASRSRPMLPYSRLRLTEKFWELGQDDLRFDLTEATSALGGADRQAAIQLNSLVGGWPAALELAKACIADGRLTDSHVAALAGSEDEIRSYLAEQLYDGLRPADQGIVTAIASVERINADLLKVLAGVNDADGALRALFDRGLPITPLKGATRWWTMHPLFREYLLKRARVDDIDLNALRRRAMHWFVENQHLAEGIVHAAATGLTTEALRMIETHGGWRLVLSGYGPHLRRILTGMGIDELVSYPRAALALPFDLAKTGAVQEARNALDQIATHLRSIHGEATASELALVDAHVRLYEDEPLGPLDASLLENFASDGDDADPVAAALISNLLCLIFLHMGDIPNARSHCARAVRSYRRANAVFGELHMRAHLGLILYQEGDLAAAEAELRGMVRGCTQLVGADSDIEAIANVMLAEVLVERGDIDGAATLVNASLDRVATSDAWLDVLASAYKTMARVALRQDGIKAATAVLNSAVETARRRRLPRLDRLAKAEKARALVLIGRYAEAELELEALLQRGDPSGLPQPTGEVDWALRNDSVLTTHARLLTRTGRPDQALAVLDRGLASTAKGSRRLSWTKMQCIRAVALAAVEGEAAAIHALADCVTPLVRQPPRQFLYDEGRPLGRLLARIEPLGLPPDVGESLPALVARADGDESEAQAGDGPPDTMMLTYLRLLAQGHSNKEIARALNVSDNTVKYHLKRIFAQLRVDNRTRAVIAAQRMTLI